MATKKKLLQAAAGNAGGEALNVEDVFSTYLYTGTGAAHTITNGIDLAGEGGLVWVKGRDQARENALADTERGTGVWMSSNLNNGNLSNAQMINQFNSDGFRVGTESDVNFSGEAFASWTFRKAPKFFDVVTYTGGSSQPGVYSHGLKSTPGMIIFKKTSGAEDWWVWHRSAGGIGYIGNLNTTGSFFNAGTAVTAVSATTFSVNYTVNGNGDSYVAYVFAHNNGDGEFGAGDADIIKCGSYTGNGSTTGPVIDLGFEPQWLLLKNASTAYNWIIVDVMRGWSASPSANTLFPNTTAAEDPAGTRVKPTSTGFQIITDSFDYNKSGDTFIYMAIRRGTKVPESGTEVFDVESGNGNGSASSPEFVSGFPVDAALIRSLGTANNQLYSRLTANKYLSTDQTDAEITNASDFSMASNEGWYLGSTTWTSWMWKRAPGYFDVVAYSGNGTAGRTVSHNLGVAPEMIWVKRRDGSQNWRVYHKGINGGSSPEDYFINLNDTNVPFDNNTFWNDTAPTEIDFTVGTQINGSSQDFIAYLFSSLDGVSKVGSVTHSGTTNVDAGFTNGSRFVLIKRTDASGDWYVWDSVRGIVSGNDPYLLLNSTAAETTNTDYIDPYSAGFTLTSSFTAGTYIYYAIA